MPGKLNCFLYEPHGPYNKKKRPLETQKPEKEKRPLVDISVTATAVTGHSLEEITEEITLPEQPRTSASAAYGS